MPTSRTKLGARGEKLAAEHLRRLGFSIRETNFRCREGEIDIVAQREDYLVFVEVRTRRGSSFGTPEESLTPAKGEKIITAAQTYIQTHEGLPPDWRIDVVAVEMDGRGKLLRVELIEDAFSG
jgi:putative endonuclease